jgi:hypothetical protein
MPLWSAVATPPLCDTRCQIIKRINTKSKEVVNYWFCIIYQHKMTNNQKNKYQNKGRGLICWLCVFLKVGGYLTSQSGVAFAFAHLTPHSINFGVRWQRHRFVIPDVK